MSAIIDNVKVIIELVVDERQLKSIAYTDRDTVVRIRVEDQHPKPQKKELE